MCLTPTCSSFSIPSCIHFTVLLLQFLTSKRSFIAFILSIIHHLLIALYFLYNCHKPSEAEEISLRSYAERSQTLYDYQKDIPSMELQINLFRRVPALRTLLSHPQSSILAIAAHANKSMASYLNTSSSRIRSDDQSWTSRASRMLPHDLDIPSRSTFNRVAHISLILVKSSTSAKLSKLSEATSSRHKLLIPKKTASARLSGMTSGHEISPTGRRLAVFSADKTSQGFFPTSKVEPRSVSADEDEEYAPSNCFTESLEREERRNEALLKLEILLKRKQERLTRRLVNHRYLLLTFSRSPIYSNLNSLYHP